MPSSPLSRRIRSASPACCARCNPLFTGKSPLLASGTVTVSPASYGVRGIAAAGVTGETFGAQNPAGWELVRFGGTSIEMTFGEQ